jgi:hypothetical protein
MFDTTGTTDGTHDFSNTKFRSNMPIAESISACILALIAVAFICPASAQTVNLACGGMMHHYPPEERIDSTVASTASSVDLTSKKVVTPIGEYRITGSSDGQISFGAPATANFDLVTTGTLDRTTGRMLIRWYRPEEYAKSQIVGQTVHMLRYAEFSCSTATRLF